MGYKASKNPYRQQRSNAEWAKVAALGLALFGLFCFVKVWQNVRVDQLMRKNQVLREQLSEIKSLNKALLIEREELLRIDRVQDIALNQLKFRKAPTIKISDVEKSDTR